MAISKKKKQQIKSAVGKASLDMMCKFAPQSLEHAPESWDEETRRIFDMLTEFEARVSSGLSEVLDEVCTTCDGSGRLRANRQTDNGYLIAKMDCHACKGKGLR